MPRLESLIFPAATVLAIVALGIWLWPRPAADVQPRLPGSDGRPDLNQQRPEVVGELRTLDGQPGSDLGDWPCFRGEDRTGVAHTDTPLARDFPDAGPPALWSVQLGEGHAGPAIRHGRVYLLDYDRDAGQDVVRCLSLDDGSDIWQYRYNVKVKRNHGMSRTVPAVSEDHVVTLGPKCHVHCLDAKTGEKRWMIDLVRDFDATVPPWYAGQCPLIDDQRVILAPGGDALMIAVDLSSGEVLWRTPNPAGWKMTHASITPMTLADGTKSYVYVASGGVAGVAADDGRLLWRYDDWTIDIAAIPSPVVVDGERIFLSGGYDAGSMMIRITSADDGQLPYRVEPLFRLDADIFGATQQTPVLYRDHILGIRPSGELTCLRLDGEVAWTSGRQLTFGLGPFLVANDLIYAMDDHGKLTLFEANTEACRPLATADMLDGHDAWGPMALVAGRLFVRDLTTMKCLDVASR